MWDYPMPGRTFYRVRWELGNGFDAVRRHALTERAAFGGLLRAAAFACYCSMFFTSATSSHADVHPPMALAFFVRPYVALVVAMLVPIVSGLVTGMPTFFPPVAPAMAVELGCMAGLLALLRRRWPGVHVLLHLVPVLLFGRVMNVALLYASSLWLDLPAAFLAGISFISGWPGLILMILVLPPIARLSATLRGAHER
jgi:hypothetical protein